MFKVYFPIEDRAFQKRNTCFQIQTTYLNPKLIPCIPTSCFIVYLLTCLRLIPHPAEVEANVYTLHFLCTHQSSKKCAHIDARNKRTPFDRSGNRSAKMK